MAQLLHTIPLLPAMKRLSHIATGHFMMHNLSPGEGTISGVTLQDNEAVVCRIDLFLTTTREYVKSVMTDLAGNYEITGIDINQMYDVVATPVSGEWERRVSSRRVPYWADPQFTFEFRDGANAITYGLY